MTAAEVTERATEHVAGRVQNGVGALSGVLLLRVREKINVKVQYQGKRVIRSKPGEPPRREFGDYYKSWSAANVVRNGNVIEGGAGTTSIIGVYLEKGTNRIQPRPHVEPTFNEIQAEAIGIVKNNL